MVGCDRVRTLLHMIVKNPTDKEISVTIKGSTYTVPANGENSNVNDEHAVHWKTHIHHFIELKQGSDVKETTEEVITEESPKEEEVIETPKEEVIEEVEVKDTKKAKKNK